VGSEVQVLPGPFFLCLWQGKNPPEGERSDLRRTASQRGVPHGAPLLCSCPSGSLTDWCGGLAQLVEHLLCKQGVSGSNPLASISAACGRNPPEAVLSDLRRIASQRGLQMVLLAGLGSQDAVLRERCRLPSTVSWHRAFGRVLGLFFQTVNLDLVDVVPLGDVGSDPVMAWGERRSLCV
jgi:hypothetical protein